jgi:hypothetical protein
MAGPLFLRRGRPFFICGCESSLGVNCGRVRPMRIGRKLLTSASLALVVLLALMVIREAFFSLTAYFVIVPGATVFAGGQPTPGWVHRGGNGQNLIVTRPISGRRESYWVIMPGEKNGWVRGCGEWSASRFPVLAIGDTSLPCLDWGGGSTQSDPPQRDPVFGPRSVEFTSNDGTRLKIAW